MNNALEVVRDDICRHQVEVKLPGELGIRSLYLLIISGQTKLINDLEATYYEVATPLHLKLAKKLFGDKESVSQYGVFLDESLKLVFAFNRRFAGYDPRTKTVVYNDLDDFLVGATNTPDNPGAEDDFSDNPVPPYKPKPPFNWGPPGGGGEMMVRYSIPDPAVEQSTVE